MSRLTWNAPERRFFETGLDRGVLYPKGTPPIGQILATNIATNPRGITPDGGMHWVFTNMTPNPRTHLPTANNTQWATPVLVAISDHPLGFTQAVELKKTPDDPDPRLASYFNFDGLLDSGTSRYNGAWVKANVEADVSVTDGVGAVMVSVRVSPNTWTWIATPTKASGHRSINADVVGRSAINADRLWVAGVRSDIHPTRFFFDGDTPDDPGGQEFQYFWEGAVNNSRSIASAPTASGWYQMSGSSVTKGPDGGLRYRNGMNGGGGMYHSSSATYGVIGRYYSARYKIRRLPGEPATPGVGITTPLWDGDSYIAHASDWNGDMAGLPADGSWRTVNVIASEPNSSVNTPVLFFYVAPNNDINFEVDEVQIEEVEGVGSKVSDRYFDGSSVSGAYTYAWLGDAHNSASTKREVLTLAVPWDGLTSVEESGGEAARAYYADGRPFLFLPMPKEYAATLSAYTYPDAFSTIMGLSEVADGMYLDSQPGQAFDFTYRTLVGNATQGQEHGYKIHLVYNATATPGALTYETLADSVNPSTMSWEIQAIPVRVEGFRPTAHIVIDTRHMDPRKIDALESLLYGSTDSVAGMPDPQHVFDLLSYGDTITVTDNGDGTFDVEGSYENVYLVGDGEFRLENIDGQNNGDGTFTISTTEG